MPTDKHNQLQETAIGWLYGRGCSVFAKEVPTWNGIADAAGVVTSSKVPTVYYIEAKASRSDLLCLKQKSCYRRTEEVYKHGIWEDKKCLDFYHGQIPYQYPNDVDFFYLIVAEGVMVEPTLYPLWGVLDETGRVIRRAKRLKKAKEPHDLITSIAHVLVYKVFGKMYATETMSPETLEPTGQTLNNGLQ